jgi:hypothetical protein
MHKKGESTMKSIVLLTILVTVGCILAAGCVAQPKKDLNVSVTPTNTFTPFVNATTVPGSNGTFNTSNSTNVTKLKGPLRVSISNFNANLSVILDNQTAGFVTAAKPLDLTIDEGEHVVKVCVGTICEQEHVNIVFAKKSFVDFGDRFKKSVEFPEPTARIIDSYRNGDGVSVVVEFINPSAKTLSMTAEVSVGYSFIAGRTGQRVGESVRGQAYSEVPAGRRVSETLRLGFADGYAYSFDPPNLGTITVK